MRRLRALLLAATAGIASGAHGESAPAAHTPPAAASTPKTDAEPHGSAVASTAARIPGFAAALSEMPVPAGSGAWPVLSYADAWGALATSNPDTRQFARWDYARSLVGSGRGAEALGVLEVMKADDPDLELVPAWQLARGAALAQMGRDADALSALSAEALATNPEACMWRMRALSDGGLAAQALENVNCALTAINARSPAGRVPFVLAAAHAAVEDHRPAVAMRWLRLLPDRYPGANLLRGRASLALGQAQEGRLRLDRVALSGDAEQRMDARLSTLEANIATHRIAPADALKQLDAIRFAWRGGAIEERALRLTAQISADAHDLRRSLAASGTLFRYFDLGAESGPTIARLQAQLATALGADGGLPLDQAAGLYWDFRDLAPAGGAGDRMVNQLANRLQSAGLYGRAAELLEYQLTARTRDVAQGPLSARVASLHILAGRPDRALRALRATDATPYPDEMLWDRRRVEAAALHLLGKTSEALAVLQDVPGGDRVRAEILWQKGDWANLAEADERLLPKGGPLSDVEQAIVLRHAIALAMLGREAPLAGLRARYAAAFAKLPTAPTFDLLTRAVGTLDPAAVSRAMASIPSASPAGSIGDLFDAQPAARTLAAR